MIILQYQKAWTTHQWQSTAFLVEDHFVWACFEWVHCIIELLSVVNKFIHYWSFFFLCFHLLFQAVLRFYPPTEIQIYTRLFSATIFPLRTHSFIPFKYNDVASYAKLLAFHSLHRLFCMSSLKTFALRSFLHHDWPSASSYLSSTSRYVSYLLLPYLPDKLFLSLCVPLVEYVSHFIFFLMQAINRTCTTELLELALTDSAPSIISIREVRVRLQCSVYMLWLSKIRLALFL